MTITIDEGVITLTGTVDAVDFAALRGKVHAHDHTIGGDVGSVTETLYVTDSGGSSRDFRTASDSGGSNQTDETADASPSSRVHDHGSGSLATSSISGSSPGASGAVVVTVDGSTGNIDCNTIDGYAPEDQADWYDGHYHGVSGTTDDTTFSSIAAEGHTSSNTYFWGYIPVLGEGEGDSDWHRVRTEYPSATHTGHDAGTISLSAYSAGSLAGPEAGVVSLDGDAGSITLGGNVNAIGIAEFKSSYDAHTHTRAGSTASGGGGKAVLRDYTSGYPIMLKEGAGAGYSYGYIWPKVGGASGAHQHSGSTLTCSTPF